MRRIKAFTLVELLVVIGIIALLISILLPTLNLAYSYANTIKCASNLRQIGQQVAIYLENYNGKFPFSNFYQGLQLPGGVGGAQQLPALPNQGYTHWSSVLLSTPLLSQSDPRLQQPSQWQVFQCPSGSLPPANTFPANSNGLSNEAGPGVLDLQAPQLSYMLNEALTPRSVFTVGFRSGNPRYYHFVSASKVTQSAATILGTEFWPIQSLMEATSNIDGATPISNSRRPVSGISASLCNPPLAKADSPYALPTTGTFGWATIDKLTPNPIEILGKAAANNGIPNPDTTLDFVGRNHGSEKLGSIVASNQPNWDLRKSNFLYVDGHVETKHVTETVYPVNQWGSAFWSLQSSGGN